MFKDQGPCDIRGPSLSIIIHIHEGAAFVHWLELIIATLETVYLVRRPIMLPNICSSLHGWDKDGPVIFHTLLKQKQPLTERGLWKDKNTRPWLSKVFFLWQKDLCSRLLSVFVKWEGSFGPTTWSSPGCNGTFITVNGLRLPGQHNPPPSPPYPPPHCEENIRQTQKHTLIGPWCKWVAQTGYQVTMRVEGNCHTNSCLLVWSFCFVHSPNYFQPSTVTSHVVSI